MFVIGITGGIGTGKSTVCSCLRDEYNAALSIADDVGRKVCEPSGSAMPDLKRLLGEDYFFPDGTMNRKKVSDKVFKEPEILKKMNEIIHPAVRYEIEKQIKTERIAGRRLFVIESALLIEAGYRNICDEFWYVFSREDIRIKRLMQGRGMSEEKARQIMSAQQPESVFIEKCDRIIDNSGDFEDTRIQIKKALQDSLGELFNEGMYDSERKQR